MVYSRSVKSIQIFKFTSDHNINKIKKILNKQIEYDSDEDNSIKIHDTQIVHDNLLVVDFSLKHVYRNSHNVEVGYYAVIKPLTNIIIIMGVQEFRIKCAFELSQVINSDDGTVTPYNIKKRNCVCIYKKLKSISSKTKINSIKIHFLPADVIHLDKFTDESYDMISFSLSNNRSAESHSQFLSLFMVCDSLDVKLFVYTIPGLTEEKSTSRKVLKIKSNGIIIQQSDNYFADWLAFFDDVLQEII